MPENADPMSGYWDGGGKHHPAEKADPMSALRELIDVADGIAHPGSRLDAAVRKARAALRASLAPETDRDAEVARIAAALRKASEYESPAGHGHPARIMHRHVPIDAAALYDAGLRAPSLEGARHPEAGDKEPTDG